MASTILSFSIDNSSLISVSLLMASSSVYPCSFFYFRFPTTLVLACLIYSHLYIDFNVVCWLPWDIRISIKTLIVLIWTIIVILDLQPCLTLLNIVFGIGSIWCFLGLFTGLKGYLVKLWFLTKSQVTEKAKWKHTKSIVLKKNWNFNLICITNKLGKIKKHLPKMSITFTIQISNKHLYNCPEWGNIQWIYMCN